MKTVLDCLESGSRYLEERGIGDARRNMQWLIAKHLGCSRIELYLQFDRPMTEEELGPLRASLKRRGAGEPLQHLLGTVEFHGHEFHCDARALIPRPETEELVEAILKRPFPRPARLLDMGTGSGVLGLALAKALGADCREAILVDHSAAALDLARRNADRLEMKVTLVESDLLAGIEGSFELIAANLPYIPDHERDNLTTEVRHDPPEALFAGPDGLDLIRRFVPQAAAVLEPGGLLALEIGHSQSDAVTALIEASSLVAAEVGSDLSGNPRFVFAHAPASS